MSVWEVCWKENKRRCVLLGRAVKASTSKIDNEQRHQSKSQIKYDAIKLIGRKHSIIFVSIKGLKIATARTWETIKFLQRNRRSTEQFSQGTPAQSPQLRLDRRKSSDQTISVNSTIHRRKTVTFNIFHVIQFWLGDSAH